jgi:membrane-bound inhibitor of C-type lysozyme
MIKTSVLTIVALTSLTANEGVARAAETKVAYVCDTGSKAIAIYDVTTPQGGVVVVIGGNTLAFSSAPSGSGARYITSAAPHAITPLEWWNKGRDATLSELKDHGGNRLIATCHQAK